MKKTIILVLCVVLCFTAFTACVSIENFEDSIEMNNGNESSNSELASSEPSTDNKPESSEDETSELPVYTPVYPESYQERVAYFSNLPINADVNDGFFNDSVFVGNSIMLHYKNYVLAKRAAVPDLLGNSSFFAAASFSYYNNKNQKPTDADCALPIYRGEKLDIGEAVDRMGVKTVYLSLMALNDIALYRDGETGVEETYKLFTQLIETLKNTHPSMNIVVINNTYLHSSSSGMKKLNNANIKKLNDKVLQYCNQSGYDYIDVNEVLLDDNNCLGTEFCSDVGSSAACHLTTAAYNAWTHILRDYAVKKTEGKWANPTELTK